MGCAFMTLLKKMRAYIAHFGKRSMTQTRGSKITQLTDTFPRNEEENYDMTKKMCSNFSKSVIMNLDLPSLSIIFLTDQLSSKQQTAVKTLHLPACLNATLIHVSCPFWLSCLWGPLIRSTIGQHFGEKDFHLSNNFWNTSLQVETHFLEEWAIEDRLTPLFPSWKESLIQRY